MARRKWRPHHLRHEREAQVEIAGVFMEHLEHSLADERDFDAASPAGDLILPVRVRPDGTIETEKGRRFGKPEPS